MNSLKKFLLLIAANLLACSISYASSPTLQIMENSYLSHNINYQGKWIIVNYWAAWCENCKKEIPELNQFSKTHPDVLVLGVDYLVTDLKQIKLEKKKLNIQYPILLGKLPTGWQIPVNNISFIPMTFIISPDNKIAKTISGPTTAKELSMLIPPLKNAP